MQIPNDQNLNGMNLVPHAVASKLTSNGGNGGWLRRCFSDAFPFNDVTTNGMYVHVEEDQESDDERNHVPEKASFFAMEPGAPGSIAKNDAFSGT